MTPTSIAKANPLVTSPPTRNRIRIVKNTVNDVIIVLLNVSLIALLITSPIGAFGISLESSRILSNTMTVSFIEKPITVSTAEMKCWSIYNGNGTNSLAKENTISVTNTSCSKATIVPNEYLQSRKRMKMYKKITKSAKSVAFTAPDLRSSEMVGKTFLVWGM